MSDNLTTEKQIRKRKHVSLGLADNRTICPGCGEKADLISEHSHEWEWACPVCQKVFDTPPVAVSDTAVSDMAAIDTSLTDSQTLPRHTDGPWSFDGHRHILRADGDIVASAHWIAGKRGDANARLIAAAPELLAACTDAVQFLENLSERDYQRLKADELVGKLNDAVAKAILPEGDDLA